MAKSMRHIFTGPTKFALRIVSEPGSTPSHLMASAAKPFEFNILKLLLCGADPLEPVRAYKIDTKFQVVCDGGQGRNRTADASLFRAALYQLSYLAIGLHTCSFGGTDED